MAQSKDSTDGDSDNDVVSIAWLDEMDEDDDEDDDDDDDDDDDYTEENETTAKVKGAKKPPAKWDLLHPDIRQRIQRAGQERAVANKKKREPETDKKRRT
jgi:hypothetical protein